MPPRTPPPVIQSLRDALTGLNIPRGGAQHGLLEYLGLQAEVRGDDEMDVVDARLSRVLLTVLGYGEADWEYNRANERGRPDYLIAPEGRPVFFLEDKRTSLELNLLAHESQLRTYASAIVPLGLLFNGRQVVAVRLLGADRLSPLLRVDLLEAARLVPTQLALDEEDAEASFLALVELFSRARFTELVPRVARLACTENEWRVQAQSINSRIVAFSEYAARLIVRLSQVAALELEEHLRACRAFDAEAGQLREVAIRMLVDVAVPPDRQAEFGRQSEVFLARLGEPSRDVTSALASLVPNRRQGSRLEDHLESLNEQVKELALRFEESLNVRRRFERWEGLQRRFEAAVGEREPETVASLERRRAERRRTFSRQCAYVFFLRILVVRVLEDKRLLHERLITDGGLDLWIQTVRKRFAPHLGEVGSGPLMELAFGQAAAFAGEGVQADLYDWFVPPESAVVDALEAVHSYDFSAIETDVIGQTYQRFLQETERHRLGHYLTPPAVVDYILDVAGYVEGNPDIIGRSVLDPACGSGSFLVHAAVRYRRALERAYPGRPVEAARAFLAAVEQHFVGIDISPFSCYLSRLNLLVQSLDAIALLRSNGEPAGLKGLPILNADSLDFRGLGTGGGIALGLELHDPVHRLRSEGARTFMYVLANPPYINVKQENIQLDDVRDSEFYEGWLAGDTNTYLLFLRVGFHYLAPGGILAYIVPSTVLGDQQAQQFRLRMLYDGGRVAHITRFYSERVLFKPVEQATSVLVIQREVEQEVASVHGGGGSGETPEEAIADVRERPNLELRPESLRLWMSEHELPRLGANAPPSANPWMFVWPVVPEQEDYYRLWEMLVRASTQTMAQLWRSLGVPIESVFSQGDVNTTHAIPFHVEREVAGAIPLYKGEEIDQLVPLDYVPELGPKKRSPFLKANPDATSTQNQVRAFEKLDRIARLEAIEAGVVLHEVAKTRVRRRIAGTWFERDGTRPVVFPHTVWVAGPLPRREGKALLGIVTSLAVNFAYHFFSTNNHVTKGFLGTLPVPSLDAPMMERLESLVDAALTQGTEVLRAFAGMGVNRRNAFKTGSPDADPITFLAKSGLARVTAQTWLERENVVIGTDGPRLTRFSVRVLFDRSLITAAGTEQHGEVFALWVDRYGEEKWAEFSLLPMPDTPGEFLRRWSEGTGDLGRVWNDFVEAQDAIDLMVMDWYQLPEDLRRTVRIGPPWLAERIDLGEEEAEGEE